jgi:hypothetical protein
MDIIRYLIFVVIPSFLGFFSIVIIDYYCKITNKKTIKIKSLSLLVIKSKKNLTQLDYISVSLFALISQIIHYSVIVLYFVLGYMKYLISDVVFCIDLARFICFYGLFLLIIIIFIYIKTIVTESK